MGSEMCIRDRYEVSRQRPQATPSSIRVFWKPRTVTATFFRRALFLIFIFFQNPPPKKRSLCTIRMAVVSRRDLSSETQSRRKPFPKNTHILGGDDGGGGGRISHPSQTPSHHAGISYPVWVQPLAPTMDSCPHKVRKKVFPQNILPHDGVMKL